MEHKLIIKHIDAETMRFVKGKRDCPVSLFLLHHELLASLITILSSVVPVGH
jgi:hypothetical protein